MPVSIFPSHIFTRWWPFLQEIFTDDGITTLQVLCIPKKFWLWNSHKIVLFYYLLQASYFHQYMTHILILMSSYLITYESHSLELYIKKYVMTLLSHPNLLLYPLSWYLLVLYSLILYYRLTNPPILIFTSAVLVLCIRVEWFSTFYDLGTCCSCRYEVQFPKSSKLCRACATRHTG